VDVWQRVSTKSAAGVEERARRPALPFLLRSRTLALNNQRGQDAEMTMSWNRTFAIGTMAAMADGTFVSVDGVTPF
jgi:hypothetical protein